MANPNKPIEEDIRTDDLEHNPTIEPKSAKAWLNLLKESEKAFEDWNDHCDNIDERYASLKRLSNQARDREFAMFWANMEVLKPSIYAKPPVPVVVPKFKDRRPVYQAASELAERCVTVAFDLGYIDELMKLIRDDLAMTDRGVVWARYESGKGGYYNHEKVCYDFKHRRDFLHSISRNWREVTWVAGASYLTRSEARKRFKKSSQDEYQNVEYKVDKDAKEVGGADKRERGKFWEIWDKVNQRVVWVAEGCEKILDEADPHLELRGFYPCTKPAYGTVQRGSLVPVPAVMQYEDQLDEVNTLTGRIHALAEALEVKGFYPAGGSELADAIETAVKIKSPGRILVPISNWAAFGGSKEVIVWLPIDVIAQTIISLVTLRKQVIEDIYQIMGLSDIMRGATDPNETLGAQQLKSQYGSIRIRDKQQELVRVARDLVEITLEIITAEFDEVTIIEMSQTELPTQDMQRKQVVEIQQQMQNQQLAMQKLAQMPEAQSMMQQNPEQAQQVMQQAQQLQQHGQQAIKKIVEKPNIEQVLRFLKNTRIRSFVLDIETDSTVQVDEMGDKQRHAEFLGVLSSLLPQLAQMMGAEPKSSTVCGELLKFAVKPYPRVSRSLDGAIDNLVDLMEQKADQPAQNPEAEKMKALVGVEQAKLKQQGERDKAELALKQEELRLKDKHEQDKLINDRQIKAMELRAKQGDDERKMMQANQKAMHDSEKHQADMIGKQMDLNVDRQKMQMAQQQNVLRASDMAARQNDRRAAQQFKQQQSLIPRPPR